MMIDDDGDYLLAPPPLPARAASRAPASKFSVTMLFLYFFSIRPFMVFKKIYIYKLFCRAKRGMSSLISPGGSKARAL